MCVRIPAYPVTLIDNLTSKLEKGINKRLSKHYTDSLKLWKNPKTSGLG